MIMTGDLNSATETAANLMAKKSTKNEVNHIRLSPGFTNGLLTLKTSTYLSDNTIIITSAGKINYHYKLNIYNLSFINYISSTR